MENLKSASMELIIARLTWVFAITIGSFGLYGIVLENSSLLVVLVLICIFSSSAIMMPEYRKAKRK